MTCSPIIKGKRQEVGQRACNNECFYWEMCLKELKVEDAPQEYMAYNNRYRKNPLFGVDLTKSQNHTTIIV